MHAPHLLGFAVLSAVASAPSGAQALSSTRDTAVVAESRGADVWTVRPRAIEAQLGFANPYGTAALAFDLSPVAWLSLNAGAGFDFAGPQAGLMTRVRWFTFGGQQQFAFFAGAGFSLGRYCSGVNAAGPPYCTAADDGYYVYEVPIAYWANVAGGYEFRSSRGFTLRLMPGVGFLLNPGDAKLDNLTGSAAPPIRRVAGSLTIVAGFAF